MSNPGLGFINPNLLANCTVETCPILSSFYNYRINLAPNITFLVLFSLAVPWFVGVWLYTKQGYWFTTAILLGLAAEIIGYTGRIISYNDQWNQNGFIIMSICLTLGPTFFAAAIYLCLALIVTVYGAENSRLAPEMYTKIVSSLALQCHWRPVILMYSSSSLATSSRCCCKRREAVWVLSLLKVTRTCRIQNTFLPQACPHKSLHFLYLWSCALNLGFEFGEERINSEKKQHCHKNRIW
jgi:hypothetical protein